MQETSRDGRDTAPMTSCQVGLLAESLLSGKPALNVLQVVVRFTGEEVDASALRAAWADLAARHQVLRLSLSPLDPAGPHQILHPEVKIAFETQDLAACAAPGDALPVWLEQDRRRGAASDRAPGWRVCLLGLGPGRKAMVWTFHHALLDGGGYRLLLRDLFRLYQIRRQGQVPAPPMPGQPDFLDHCRAVAALDHGPSQEFFRRHLAGFDTPNRLDPVFSPDPKAADATDPQCRRHLVRRLDPGLSLALRERAARAGASTANLICAAWGLVLARCSGRQEAVFGLTRAGRHLIAGGQGIAGCQINTLPCRVRLAGATLGGILRGLREFTLGLHTHEHVPLSAIAAVCDLPGGVAPFDTLVMFDRGSLPQQMQALGPDWAHRHVEEQSQMATMLSLSAYDDPGMLLRLDHDPARVSDHGAARIMDYLQAALAQMASAPDDLPLARLDMLPAAETRRLLALGQPEAPRTRAGTSVMARFEAVAESQPDRIAVTRIGHQRGISYGTLERRANHLARRLRAQGVGPGDVVGLALPRSADFVVALLAVLKAEAAFLPLDPGYPAPVLADMIARAHAVAILSARGVMAHLGPQQVPVLLLDDPALTGEDGCPPEHSEHDPARRAYVIFTSGSTGRPKGVEVPHRALAQHAQAIIRLFGLSDADRVLQFASLNFDVSIEEILPTLLAGAQLVLRSDEVAHSVPDFLAALAGQGITLCNLPTAFWHVLVAHLDENGLRLPPGLRLVVVGGERVSGEMLTRWQALYPDIRWLNGYGPTEATITSVCYDAARIPFTGGDVPIGRPTGHARAYVMCPDGSLAPEGAMGELWLGGPAVALGYLDEPRLTGAAFRRDPFGPADTPGPDRVYRTGDRVSWRPDGLLAYHDRLDRQIKLRGFRIELSAIEAALETAPAVSAAVAALDDAGRDHARILAWVRLREGDCGRVDEAALTRHLRDQLPAPMLPCITIVKEFPQTPGGKVDTDRLPRPAIPEVADAAPADQDTARMQAIFRDLLGREAVGPDQSFFDLGGHSLLSVRLMSLIERQFGQRLTLATLYQSPTPRLIAAELGRSAGTVPNCLVPLQPQGSMPPLYAVHILGPKGRYFRPLAAQLGPDQPVIGLTLDLLDPSAPASLPEIAAIYRDNIQRHCPSGPVRLIAVSQGGYIAYELAQQLLAAGRDVAALYLLDTEGPGGRPRRAPPPDRAGKLRKLRHNFRGIVNSRWHRLHENLSFQLERLRLSLSRGRLSSRLVSRPQTDLAHQAAIDLAIAAYHPAPYPRRITLFVGRDNPFDTPEGIASGLGWNVVAPAGLHIIETAGLHLAMVHEPWLRELVRHLRPLLHETATRDRP